ncbi:hypothetical protein D9M70_575410 [compost metagenome]
MAALGRPHADGGETLNQLHVAVAAAGGVDDVAHLQVLVEVDEILALGMGEDRPVEVDPRLTIESGLADASAQAQCLVGAGGDAGAVQQHVVQVVAAVHRTGDAQAVR